MRVREMRQGDVPALQAVYFQTRSEKFHWIESSRFRVADFERDTEGEAVWVAEWDGSPVGFVSVWRPENFIHHLFVLPGFARKGIGSALLSVCLETIGRPARLKCVVVNHDAIAFYKARGWQIESTAEGADGPYHLMRMDER